MLTRILWRPDKFSCRLISRPVSYLFGILSRYSFSDLILQCFGTPPATSRRTSLTCPDKSFVYIPPVAGLRCFLSPWPITGHRPFCSVGGRICRTRLGATSRSLFYPQHSASYSLTALSPTSILGTTLHRKTVSASPPSLQIVLRRCMSRMMT